MREVTKLGIMQMVRTSDLARHILSWCFFLTSIYTYTGRMKCARKLLPFVHGLNAALAGVQQNVYTKSVATLLRTAFR